MANTWTHTETKPVKASNTARNQAADKSAAEKQVKEPALKGTFASVMILGGFIIVSWVLVFALFLSRN